MASDFYLLRCQERILEQEFGVFFLTFEKTKSGIRKVYLTKKVEIRYDINSDSGCSGSSGGDGFSNADGVDGVVGGESSRSNRSQNIIIISFN